jgi:hypothetical protein
MKTPYSTKSIQELRGARRRYQDAIALVITLLMLSVITFLAVAFLAMTRRDRAAAISSVDANGARTMSEAALARAQAEVMARMMAQTDWLSYDYMVSQNYINPSGFRPKVTDTTNVNYDIIWSGGAGPNSQMSSTGANAAYWALNIANLFYDPRPPVFVVTNAAYPTNSDFRFWVDVNRNGRFESNGYIPTVNSEVPNAPLGPFQVMSGEPEWIGVLNDPLYRHSSSNRFIGRYAYMVLPIGKTLDLNYIHNWAKGNYVNAVRREGLTNNVGIGAGLNPEGDGFARDQGVGSWELNLAAMFDVLSPWTYESTTAAENPYYYGRPYYYDNYPALTSSGPNTGFAFDDAESFAHYRIWNPNLYLASLRQSYFNFTMFEANHIDTYCVTNSFIAPFDYNTDPNDFGTRSLVQAGAPWPGSYSTNLFYDPQDLFDPNKTSIHFTNRLLLAENRTNFFDRYTFQRLLQCVGTGSSPEYGVFVYTNGINPYQGQPPTWLRTKVNLNYDNTSQIQNSNAPFVPMPTNLTTWAPQPFFSNAADLLLRSQEFFLATNVNIPASGVTNYGWVHFGITNIPIYNYTNATIRYSGQIHRMLQLAANLYDESGHAGTNTQNPTLLIPHVFRPQFQITPGGFNGSPAYVTITNYALVTNDFATQIEKGFLPITSPLLSPLKNKNVANANISGVPWVVGAVKGLPSFNRYSCQSREVMTRKVVFVRPPPGGPPDYAAPPAYTNQFYVMCISNIIGMDVWNPYASTFLTQPQVYVYASNFVQVQVTNNYNYGYVTNLYLTTSPLAYPGTQLSPRGWPGWSGAINSTNSFVSFFQTNFVSLPPGYYSEHWRQYIPFTNANISQNSFLPADLTQTGWPVHNWSVNITNYVCYYMYYLSNSVPTLLDFVNIGPIGTTTNFGAWFDNNNPWFAQGRATDLPNSPMSVGLLTQIQYSQENDAAFNNSLLGKGPPYKAGPTFSALPMPADPAPYYQGLGQPASWVANDPLVHYTVDDLTWPGGPTAQDQRYTGTELLVYPLTNDVGTVSLRYDPWNNPRSLVKNNWVFKDPMITRPDDWQFPTNSFPSVGWIGRVHRGTPWQTVYLKPNSQNLENDVNNWVNHWVANPAFSPTVASWPTNDWALLDLFTTVPNDNAARGLLSINQTNDAAWAAVFAGIVALSNVSSTVVIGTNINPYDVTNLVDSPTNSIYGGGINALRPANGLYHRVGDILAAPALTVSSPWLNRNAPYTDDEVERIPQQMMGLVKVGYPQFVIYSWGQSLRPQSFYLGTGAPASYIFGLCTNYEITGEVLTRTVCHVVSGPDPTSTNGPSPRFVVDSFNVEP